MNMKQAYTSVRNLAGAATLLTTTTLGVGCAKYDHVLIQLDSNRAELIRYEEGAKGLTLAALDAKRSYEILLTTGELPKKKNEDGTLIPGPSLNDPNNHDLITSRIDKDRNGIVTREEASAYRTKYLNAIDTYKTHQESKDPNLQNPEVHPIYEKDTLEEIADTFKGFLPK